METLKNYVNWKLAHSDKTATAEGYPLVMENCKTGKRMKQLEVYGNCLQSQIPSPDCPVEIQSTGDLVNDTSSEYYGKYSVPVTIYGKNLFDYSSTEPDGYYLSGNGAISTGGTKNLRITDYIPIPNNITALTFSFSNGAMQSPGICLYDKDKKYITGSNFNGKFSITINVPSNAKYVRHSYRIININILLECGSIATEYEPYIEPITQNIYLDEPLRGALYQSREKQWYYDVIDYKSHKVIRNITEKTFTGATNEKWTMSKETDNKIHFYISGIPNNCSFGASDDDSIICNLFNESYVHATQNSDKEGISLAFTTNICYIAIFKTRLTDAGLTLDLDGFKTWLSQNPITVTYISKTPTEEDISCQLPKTLAKTTIIDVDTSLLPSNIKGKYIIK